MPITRLVPISSRHIPITFLILMALAIVLMLVHSGTTIAGEAESPIVEPYNPEDLAYLDQGKTIPWADAATVAAFVAHLKSYPKMKYDVPQVPRQPWMTYFPELPANNYVPEKIENRAPAIANFKRQLEALGIDMIFLPIPEGGMIYPDQYWEMVPLNSDGLPPQTTEGNRRLFAALDKLGVRYVNLTPAMILARKYSRHGHCREFLQGYDGLSGEASHWTYYGVAVSAHVVAAEIAKLPWYKSLPKLDGLKAEWVAPMRYGPEDDPRGWRWERKITGVPKDLTNAPIMVVGDSNMEYGFGFHQQLMYELKVPVDIFGGEGKNPNVLVRRARENPDWLLKKKLVIWSIANRYMPSEIHDHVIFPEGIEMARKRVVALADLPSRINALVTLEKNSTAKTPEQWQPYTKALIYGCYRVERSGLTAEDYYMPPYTPKTIMAAGWGLLDAQQTWLTRMKPGTRYQISAESMIDHPELEEMAVDQDAYEDLALQPYLITDIKDPDGKPLVDANGKQLTLPLFSTFKVVREKLWQSGTSISAVSLHVRQLGNCSFISDGKLLAYNNDPAIIYSIPDALVGQSLLVHIVLMAPQGYHSAQIFYHTATTNYNETDSERIPLTEGRNEMYFTIPKEMSIGELRFDPGEIAGMYMISTVEAKPVLITSPK